MSALCQKQTSRYDRVLAGLYEVAET